jgi:hypothetical protein
MKRSSTDSPSIRYSRDWSVSALPSWPNYDYDVGIIDARTVRRDRVTPRTIAGTSKRPAFQCHFNLA